jgi:hypothetical protein
MKKGEIGVNDWHLCAACLYRLTKFLLVPPIRRASGRPAEPPPVPHSSSN